MNVDLPLPLLPTTKMDLARNELHIERPELHRVVIGGLGGIGAPHSAQRDSLEARGGVDRRRVLLEAATLELVPEILDSLERESRVDPRTTRMHERLERDRHRDRRTMKLVIASTERPLR